MKLEGSRDSKVTNYLTVDQLDFDTPVEIRNIINVKKEILTEYKFPVEQQKTEIKKQSAEGNKIMKQAVQSRIDSYVIDNDPLAGQEVATNSGSSWWISNPSLFNGEEG
ncbi:hypothetical protein E1H99_06805 [Enterococcus hirae]|nr:hypothetical protein E1H99_06805 [Enterococcus hirae]